MWSLPSGNCVKPRPTQFSELEEAVFPPHPDQTIRLAPVMTGPVFVPEIALPLGLTITPELEVGLGKK